MSFYRYGRLRSREDVTQLDRGRVRQTRLLLSGAVSSAQEETPVKNLLTVVSRETSCEPAAGKQHGVGRQMTGDPSSASSLEDSPEAQLTCPSSAKALLPYHRHKQGSFLLLPLSSSYSSPWPPNSKCKPCIHTRCVPSTPGPGHREVCAPTDGAEQMENVGTGAAR